MTDLWWALWVYVACQTGICVSAFKFELSVINLKYTIECFLCTCVALTV